MKVNSNLPQKFIRIYFSFDEWNIVQCKHCGLIYVNPRITEDVNQKYYQFNLDGDLDFIEHILLKQLIIDRLIGNAWLELYKNIKNLEIYLISYVATVLS